MYHYNNDKIIIICDWLSLRYSGRLIYKFDRAENNFINYVKYIDNIYIYIYIYISAPKYLSLSIFSLNIFNRFQFEWVLGAALSDSTCPFLVKSCLQGFQQHFLSWRLCKQPIRSRVCQYLLTNPHFRMDISR